MATIAAVGMVVNSWRNTLEAWHNLFTNAQMSRMSLTATSDIAPFMNPATNQPDFAAKVRHCKKAGHTVLTPPHPGSSASRPGRVDHSCDYRGEVEEEGRALENFISSVLLFGCGKVGIRLGEVLIGAGHRVFAVRRDIGVLPRSFTGIALDYRRPFTAELPSVDSMVVTLTPGASERESPDLVNPLLRLAAALPTQPRRVILVSSTRVFDGDPGLRTLTEEDLPSPASPRAQALLDSESEARRLFDAVVIRPAGIYGPGREHLIRQVARGIPMDRQRRTNRIHETDLVRALHELLRAPKPPPTLHAVDNHPATRGEVADYIAHRLRVPAPPGLPTGPSGHVISGERFASLLGTLRYPDYRSGYDDIIAARGPLRE